jgi:glycosyltransferase involved in cell wall biosynthesis
VIAGSGEPEYVARLEARVMRMDTDGSGARVRFAGFVAAAAKTAALDAADVFVLPSFHENFGVAVLEAVAAGLPVVVSPDVQLASFVRRHGVGVVADREAAALADALVATLGDEPLRRRAASRGPLLVREHFSPETVGAGLGAMYEAALSRSGAPLQGTR